MVIKMLRNEARREQRRSFGIVAYTGANGGGKSACMVWDSLPSLEAGRPVLSTVRIQDYTDPRPCDDDWCSSNPDVLDHYRMRPTAAGKEAMIRNSKAQFFYGPGADQEEVELASAGVHLAAHPLWIPWTHWKQLLDHRFGEVLADEMTGIAEARGAMTLPPEVIDQFQQLRRADIPFRYTMPSWDRADVSLRQPTQVVVVCKGLMKRDYVPAEGEEERQWRPARLFRWHAYDAMNLTQLTEGKRSELAPVVKEMHWGPGSPAWAAYDTFAPVLKVGAVTKGGRCYDCGGQRTAPKCSCHVVEDGLDLVQLPTESRRRRRRGSLPAATEERGQGASPARAPSPEPGRLDPLSDPWPAETG